MARSWLICLTDLHILLIPLFPHSAALELMFFKQGSALQYELRNAADEHFVWSFAWKLLIAKSVSAKKEVHMSCSMDWGHMQNHRWFFLVPFPNVWWWEKIHHCVLPHSGCSENHNKCYGCTRHTWAHLLDLAFHKVTNILNILCLTFHCCLSDHDVNSKDGYDGCCLIGGKL